MGFFTDSDQSGSGLDDGVDKAAAILSAGMIGGGGVMTAAGTLTAAAGTGMVGLAGLLAAGGAGATMAMPLLAPLGLTAEAAALGLGTAGLGLGVAGAGMGLLGAGSVASGGVMAALSATGAAGDLACGVSGAAEGIYDFFAGPAIAPGTPAGPPSLRDVL